MSAPAAWLGRQLAAPSGVGGRLVAIAMRLANRRVVRAAIGALAVQHGDAVLDLGCGAGDALPALARLSGRQVVGIDHSRSMLALARHRSPDAILLQASFDALPLPAASIDRIFAVNVAYFWAEPASVMAELRRILRSPGRLVVYATDSSSLARVGLDRTGTHRPIDGAVLARMLGPRAVIRRIDAGLGVTGWLATLDS